MSNSAPILFVPHGGGPMPLLGDPAHAGLSAFLRGLPTDFSRPRAVLVLSAHWEEQAPTLYADPETSLLFDYYGFPPQSYRFAWPAPGNRRVADEIRTALSDAGFACGDAPGRGFDHGVFVPMLLMYPQADVVCVQLSLIGGLDAAIHLALGRALAPLRERGVLILGSGMSFHNLRALVGAGSSPYREASDVFADWLVATMTDEAMAAPDRLAMLTRWREAPYAGFCHPRAEHFIPLLVCAGAACGAAAACLYDAPLMGHRVNGFGWS